MRPGWTGSLPLGCKTVTCFKASNESSEEEPDITGTPLTLIDSGPNSAKALDELELALAAHSYAIEDIELLVVSHQHIDHFGLGAILARRSGAEVAALDILAPFLARFGQAAELDDSFAEGVMMRHGIPP